jgi:hypothetical protein
MKGTSIFQSLVVVFVMLAFCTAALADAGPENGVIRDHFLTASPSVRELAMGAGPLRTQRVGQEPVSTEESPVGVPGLKSPGKALLFSAILPGAGEYYAGAWKRGLVFSALEVTSWIWYFTQHSSGRDKEDEYMAFADSEWDRGAYEDWYEHWEDWYNARKGDNDPPFDRIFTHQLPDQMNDDYYEMIGKYDQFAWGWIGNHDDYFPSDFAPNDSLLGYGFPQTTADICGPVDFHIEFGPPGSFVVSGTPGVDATAIENRAHYVNLRGESNDLLKRAVWGINASLFNHVISALDAVVAVKAFNRRAVQEGRYPQLRMKMDRYAGEVIPKFTLTQRF